MNVVWQRVCVPHFMWYIVFIIYDQNPRRQMNDIFQFLVFNTEISILQKFLFGYNKTTHIWNIEINNWIKYRLFNLKYDSWYWLLPHDIDPSIDRITFYTLNKRAKVFFHWTNEIVSMKNSIKKSLLTSSEDESMSIVVLLCCPLLSFAIIFLIRLNFCEKKNILISESMISKKYKNVCFHSR